MRKPDIKTKTDPSRSPEQKSHSKEDLKSVPLAGVEKKLETSSDGFS
ncbi:MAG: hypothetical protein IPJ23_11045 [Ignavibacteriales bacterium]|nr:hypothetical protein [Ignavibacteriales bacterium]